MLTTVMNLSVSVVFIASIYVLIGVGLSLLYVVSQTINLAHGDFMVVGAYLTFLFISSLGLAPLWMLIIGPVLMGVLGLILYKAGGFSSLLRRPISRPNREYTTLIMTFALAWVASNALAAAI